PRSRRIRTSATTAAGTKAWSCPASTRPSAARAAEPSLRGAASMKTQACVSRTYLRATAAPSLAERPPEHPADAREGRVGRHRTTLEEAEEPSRRISDGRLVGDAALQIHRDLRREGTMLAPRARLERALQRLGKPDGDRGIPRHGCILHHFASHARSDPTRGWSPLPA